MTETAEAQEPTDPTPQITGYRDLTEEEVNLINHITTMGASIHGMMDALYKIENIDRHWLDIATTDFQTGLMAAVRAVARPESF